MKPGFKIQRCLLAAALLATGCSVPRVQDVPLPGGADLGDHPYTVTAKFHNVLNLVPQAAVKVNDVAVGRVTKVTLPKDGWVAEVTLVINGDVKLPADALAKLQQSSLLGEKFIELEAPAKGTGRLADKAVIPVERTNRNTEVEEVFGALSMLLNGGGLPQLRTITEELNKALSGNEPEIKSMLQQVGKLTSGLEKNKTAITDALEGINRVSGSLKARTTQIDNALTDLAPGLKVLEQQRGSLVRMLGSLEKLSEVAVGTLDKSQKNIIADLKALEPTLQRLSQAGKDLPQALEVLFTYPFTDAVLPAIKGDYLNTYLSVTAVPGTEIIPPLTPQPPLGGK